MNKPPSSSNEIDRLYQLPLAEFTPERNALAKRLGKAGAAIRALEKPSLPAWAVNQLYWRQRSAFNRVVSAAADRRTAHAKRLTGKGGDVDAAEAAHRAAVREAADEIRGILSEAGAPATTATLHAVMETLQALPGTAEPGRLTKPLALVGFEALAGIVPNSARTLRGLTPPPVPAVRPVASKPDPAADARREASARKARADAERVLRDARQAAKKAEAALAAAKRTLAREKDARSRLQDQLQFAAKKIDDAAAEMRSCEERLAQANQEQSHLEAKLAALG